MKRKIILTVLVSALFFTSFNSVIALTYARFNKALSGSSKSVVASSNTIWVPDNYTTIQEAINSASEGDIIFVRNGTYPEHVVVNKALSLVGENKHDTIIDGKGTGTVVSAIANNITISGFTIQNGRLGIRLEGSRNSILTGNIVSPKNLYGIYLYHSSNDVISDNDASNNDYGIHIGASDNNVITDNHASNNTYGILVGDSDNNVISNNYASNNTYGIYLYYSSNDVISDNDASNNTYGIFVGTSSNNVISDNHASNNDYGLYFYYSSNNVIPDNYASNNAYGIFVGDSDNNVITDNHASNNTYGIHPFNSDNNIIFHNNFINNTEPPSSINSVNSFDNGVEGNYWSDYNGTDANWDGIGDTPYLLDENIQDNYPLVGPFSEFDVNIGNQSYTVDIVCNSTISNFRGYYDAGNQTNVVSFMVNGTEGKGFCRICIPHALIEPQYIVTIDRNPPLYYNNTVHTNGTHTWLYFTYHHSEHEVIIIHMPTPPPEQLAFWFEWWFWTIIALAVIVVVLLSLSIKQKKVIQAYERELRSHLYRARALFKADVEKRRSKIEEFKRKYHMEIRTSDNLEDFFKRWEFKKKVKH